MTDWIDLVSREEPFIAYQNMMDHEYGECGFNAMDNEYSSFIWDSSDRGQELTINIERVTPVILDSRPAFMFMSKAYTTGANGLPNAPSPAPAQRATHITMIWVKDNKTLTQLSYDESVGMPAPQGAMHITPCETSHPPGSTGTFLVYNVVPHRDDGFPAVISIGNLKKHYREGKLHRSGTKHAALRAGYVGALWMQDGKQFRTNGPTGILLKDYREYYSYGKFSHRTASRAHLTWDRKMAEFYETIEGDIDPFSNSFFTDLQDEMMCVAV